MHSGQLSGQLPEPSTRRTELDLTTAQLRAIDAYHRTRRAGEAAADTAGLTREMRLDLSRRTEARRRERQALLARAASLLESSGEVPPGRPRVRAVLAHRNGWLRDKVAERLAQRGVIVVGTFDDGADAAGTVIVEQPDLLLVEDRLPTLSGDQVVRRTRTYAPETVIGAQVLDNEGIRAFVDAGAHAVFTRRIPPAEMADQLLSCLTGDRSVRALI